MTAQNFNIIPKIISDASYFREPENEELADDQKRKIKFIVIHHTQAKSVEEAREMYISCGVSAHFVIDIKGNIFLLCEEKNIAYHAGISFWSGQDGLNKNSIGIEFLSFDPEKIGFTKDQMKSGISLCKYLIQKYGIENRNIVGHSDIAYYKASHASTSSARTPTQNPNDNLLNRKQDPSHLFDWKFFAENGVGIYPKIDAENEDGKLLFKLGNKDAKILEIKKSLQKIGYKINNLNDEFDDEMQILSLIFHRHFHPQKISANSADGWHLSSDARLENLLRQI